MKKIIIILILVVYIASIAIVNFFGLETKIFQGISYVTDIQCNSVTVQREDQTTVYPEDYLVGNKKAFIFEFIPAPDGQEYTTDYESIITNPNAITLNYEVFPHTADERGVEYEFDEKANEGVIYYHEASKTFVFLKPNRGITVTIVSKDGSKITTEIYILGRINEQ